MMSRVDRNTKCKNLPITIEDAALCIDVTRATIRNWIKMGYLTTNADGLITIESLDSFRSQNIGVNKLTSRANKLQKPHKESAIKFNFKRWQEYEQTLSEAHRNREGIYYTPINIVEDMLSHIDASDLSDKLFLDPCCGSGNFLIAAIKIGIPPQNVYGFDIDPNAVKISKRRIEEATGYKSKNIICADFLNIANSVKPKFDYIFTNPPWGKRISSTTREPLCRRYQADKSADSSTLFLLASLQLLLDGGKLGFLVQDALFNIGGYSNIRKKLFELKVECLIDYGRAFQSLLTKAKAIIATNIECDQSDILCRRQEQRYLRSYSSFRCNPNLIFNLCATPEESEVIEMLFQRDDFTTLRGAATWGLGVVTGNNNKFCASTPREGFREVYRGSDISLEGFKTPSLYIDSDLSQYQQCASQEMYYAPSKIIYKFISSRLCFICDRGQRLILNSANFLILNDDFPVVDEELVKLLNSDFMNWLFQKIFSTHKVLRGDLETLPLFLNLFEDGKFCEDSYINGLNIKKMGAGYCKITP